MTFISLVDYPANGTTYQVPFPYVAASTVFAEVDGTDDANRTINASGEVVLSTTPAAGSTVRIRRRTPSTYWGSFPPGARPPNEELNQAMLAQQYYIEEVYDASLLAIEATENLEPLVTSEIQYITTDGSQSYQLNHNYQPKNLEVSLEGIVQHGDLTLLGGSGGIVSKSWAIWYDTINSISYIKFFEAPPSGLEVQVRYFPALQPSSMLSTITSDAIQYVTADGTDNYVLNYSPVPTALEVYIDGAAQYGDTTVLSSLSDTVNRAWALWYDVPNSDTYIKFAEAPPSGSDLQFRFRSTQDE